jgi:hypothetical protein
VSGNLQQFATLLILMIEREMIIFLRFIHVHAWRFVEWRRWTLRRMYVLLMGKSRPLISFSQYYKTVLSNRSHQVVSSLKSSNQCSTNLVIRNTRCAQCMASRQRCNNQCYQRDNAGLISPAECTPAPNC